MLREPRRLAAEERSGERCSVWFIGSRSATSVEKTLGSACQARGSEGSRRRALPFPCGSPPTRPSADRRELRACGAKSQGDAPDADGVHVGDDVSPSNTPHGGRAGDMPREEGYSARMLRDFLDDLAQDPNGLSRRTGTPCGLTRPHLRQERPCTTVGGERGASRSRDPRISTRPRGDSSPSEPACAPSEKFQRNCATTFAMGWVGAWVQL